ncbi:MAG: ABC transporter permease [Edaphobacter sp.]|uniref:ABC transporter permease n=1 Tax=Edaphobacter sp. TaxID=1934404 RepID=UPI00239FC96C|nr:ABC transporter permease [Edaphobacter sp.]MDE1175317.1 ABC transporter permease [Edaphobacter sp.]
MLKKSFKIAVKALRANKLRTGLAMLGMTIGVAAVLTMFALGTGAQQSVSKDVKSAGTTLINIRAGNFTRGGEESKIATGLGSATTLTTEDADAVRAVSGVAHVSPVSRMRGWVAGGGDRSYTQIYGVGSEYAEMYDWGFEKGKFFKQSSVDSAENVAVIGAALRDTLFPDSNPIGEEIEIHGEIFKVRGVFSTSDEEQSQMAVVPYTKLQKLLGVSYLSNIMVSADQAGNSSQVATDVIPVLRSRHHLDTARHSSAPAGLGGLQGGSMAGATPDDFTVKTQASEALTKGLNTSVAAFILANMPQMDQVNLQEMSGTLSRAGQTMTALLAAIATISLIVGGIGIMNIMLVSVTERTREIGIRRAVGARSYDVLMQFLVEAVTLGMAGGVLGIILGFLASFAITKTLDWDATVSPQAVALAFGISAATGVFFGFYPARRAAKLNPIEALRFE